MNLEHLDTAQEGTTRPGWALRLIARALRGLDTGQVTLIGPSGERVIVSGRTTGVAAVWHFRRPWRAIVRLLRHGDIGFAEGFIAGDWNTPDLQGLLRFAADNEQALTALAERDRKSVV